MRRYPLRTIIMMLGDFFFVVAQINDQMFVFRLRFAAWPGAGDGTEFGPLPFLAAERPQFRDLTGDLMTLRDTAAGNPVTKR